jgi:hypothetical protein
MRPIEADLLWIGHAGDLREPRAILSAGVEAVVELADNEPGATLPRELIRLRFPLSDGGGNPPWLLRLASNSLAALIEAHVPALVCCSNGMSRSVCIVAAGLLLARGSRSTKRCESSPHMDRRTFLRHYWCNSARRSAEFPVSAKRNYPGSGSV